MTPTYHRPTTLLRGGRIHSPASPDATAMAIVDDTVVWVGHDAAAMALYGDDAEIIDLAGAFVAPAFVDAHVHATATGLLLQGLDLTGCRSLPEVLDALARYRADHPGEVIWGHGWDETSWPERRVPSRAEIDAACAGAPVYLSRIDVHSALVSTAMLDAAPSARTSPGYHPTGPLTTEAHHLVRRVAQDSLTPAQRHRAQLAFLRHAASRGIAAVHECAGPDISSPADLTELLGLSLEPDLPDLVGYWGELDGLGAARELGAAGLAGDLFVDGALGSRTAHLHSRYADAEHNGLSYLDADQIARHLVACSRHGLQAGFHVIGDAATSAVVRGFELAEDVLGLPALVAGRHRLEHLEMVDAHQAAQLARWGVVASMQPNFDAAWGGSEGMYAARLGAERAAGLNPFAMLAAAGVTLAFGSDTPVTPVDPWSAVRAAVHHRTPGSGISPRAAFTAHTRGGWRAAGQADDLLGTLVPGAPATYAVWEAGELVGPATDSRVARWSTDPRSRVPRLPRLDAEAELPRCLRTVLRGQVIYDHESAGDATLDAVG
ncbi:amidohydrolase [Actinoalloteichus caeruleus]|uniref:amidohydrolase n=1 Tax=Actinoalloteichus cyanogriseus TaxID=2893586 RepID=UPI003BB92E0C